MSRNDLRRLTLLALMIAMLAIAVPSFAKGKPSSASLSVPGVNPHAEYGSTVTVNSDGGGQADAFANISCYQDGVIVYSQWNSTGTSQFTLGPTQRWTSGDADCMASVQYLHKNGRWRTMATYGFTAVDK